MKKFIFSVVLCSATYLSMSQYVQGTIVASSSSASAFNICGKSTMAFNYPIREVDFVVSIPSSASSGVTAKVSSSILPAAGDWYQATTTTVGSRTYFSFMYLYSSGANTTQIKFVPNTQLQLATVTFSGLSAKSTVRLTDENSDGQNANYYWYVDAIGTPGQDQSGEISADPTIGQQVYYANSGQSALGAATSGNYQYVETISSSSSARTSSNFEAITPMVILEESKKVSVYPSPAYNTINVDMNNPSLYGSIAKVMDLKGSTVKTFMISRLKQQIDLTNLSSGMYYIGFANGTSIAFVKK